MTVGSQVKSCYASIKSAEASLEMLANKAKDQETKNAFFHAGNILLDIKSDLKQQVIELSKEEPQY
ncbi:DUF1657 domain-containing protein [Virgibacillus xinjiangensis]|uniref:DUF1657 domain-containing protein n=1 Tax=Virgibacillus xinjiangensis TaxID=393090 RepID=A0ABV7CUB5_9BACI